MFTFFRFPFHALFNVMRHHDTFFTSSVGVCVALLFVIVPCTYISAEVCPSNVCALTAQAGGDVRRKGDKFEPFAYLPLDPRAMSSK